MILERLLQNLALHVEPFATCGTAPGWRLSFPAWEWVTFHFVMEGEGTLTKPTGRVQALGPHTLAVVPPQRPHSVESGDVRREVAAGDASTLPLRPTHLFAGPVDDPDSLSIACGRVQVTYGSCLGLFDRLEEILVLDFSDSRQMHDVFTGLMREQLSDQPGRETMIASLMNRASS